jgi:hypothetical protein
MARSTSFAATLQVIVSSYEGSLQAGCQEPHKPRLVLSAHFAKYGSIGGCAFPNASILRKMRI